MGWEAGRSICQGGRNRLTDGGTNGGEAGGMRAQGDEGVADAGMAELVHSVFGRPVPYIDALGLVLVERLPRGVVLRLPYRAGLIGNPDDGVLYGGAVSGLIDTACGFAAMVALPEPGAAGPRMASRRAVATLDLRIDYLRPAVAGADLLARAECYRLTRRIAFCRATAFSEASKDPVAEALGTFMIAGPAAQGSQE